MLCKHFYASFIKVKRNDADTKKIIRNNIKCVLKTKNVRKKQRNKLFNRAGNLLLYLSTLCLTVKT